MDLQKKVYNIAAHLDGWEYVNPPEKESDYHLQREAILKDGHGRRIVVSLGWKNKSLISCSGILPQNEGVYVSDICQIGFNIERDSKQLARDIKRRLLPNYIERYDYYIDMHHKYQARKAIVKAHYERMLKLIGDDTFGLGHVINSSYVVYQIQGKLNGSKRKAAYIDIHINDWNVALEINVPHAVADAIIKLLKEM